MKLEVQCSHTETQKYLQFDIYYLANFKTEIKMEIGLRQVDKTAHVIGK